MKKLLSFLFVVGLAITQVNAQRIVVNGYLKDKVTQLPIAGGSITNINSSNKIASDRKGYFSIAAAANDFIFVLAKGYQYDTLKLSFLSTDTITIYLSPSANFLPSVTVKAQYTKYQADSMQRRAAFETGIGPKMRTVSAPNSGGFGIAINLDKFTKEKYRGRGKSESTFEDLERTAYIDHRFSPQLVHYYTGFTGDTLQLFMQRFTPAYTWLRLHPTHEDVLYYINDKMKEFKKL